MQVACREPALSNGKRVCPCVYNVARALDSHAWQRVVWLTRLLLLVTPVGALGALCLRVRSSVSRRWNTARIVVFVVAVVAAAPPRPCARSVDAPAVLPEGALLALTAELLPVRRRMSAMLDNRREREVTREDVLPDDVGLSPLPPVLEPELAPLLPRRATREPDALPPGERRREPILGEVVLAPRVARKASLAPFFGREGNPDHVVDAVQAEGVGDLVPGEVDRTAASNR